MGVIQRLEKQKNSDMEISLDLIERSRDMLTKILEIHGNAGYLSVAYFEGAHRNLNAASKYVDSYDHLRDILQEYYEAQEEE